MSRVILGLKPRSRDELTPPCFQLHHITLLINSNLESVGIEPTYTLDAARITTIQTLQVTIYLLSKFKLHDDDETNLTWQLDYGQHGTHFHHSKHLLDDEHVDVFLLSGLPVDAQHADDLHP